MLEKIIAESKREKTMDDVKNAVHSFNNSPWIIEGNEYNLEDTIQRAKDEGINVILNGIRRADIKLFHAEEARCGNI